MIKCSKRSYENENLAVDALIEARIRFDNNSAVAVYCCDDCGLWHLTSQGSVNIKLKAALDNGSIKKNKEAYYWQKKLGF
jgi:hypothetical protein